MVGEKTDDCKYRSEQEEVVCEDGSEVQPLVSASWRHVWVESRQGGGRDHEATVNNPGYNGPGFLTSIRVGFSPIPDIMVYLLSSDRMPPVQLSH
jgi:hypothetical protein